MNTNHLMLALTAAWLLTPASVNVVTAQGEQHAGHGSVKGRCPKPSVRPPNAFEM
jgi:hypothetical protein